MAMTRNLFRRKITCFYCGKQTLNPRADGKLATLFKCPHCESLNHFDENGEIMDYVPEDLPPSPNLAARAVSPDEFSAPAFCAHCQKNQQIIMNTLAEYLPPEDDPSYDKYLENYPLYKAQLEERFPTVCSECEGLVSQMIHKANYKAKTRGLAQFLAKAEDNRRKYQQKESWGWKKGAETLLWAVRGTGWVAATAAVWAWHVTGALYTNEELEMALLDESWQSCIAESAKKSYPDLSCYGVLVSALWKWLPWSILFAGWNYQMLAERRHPKASLYGHADYLKWEGFILLLRLLSWWILLPQGSGWEFTPGTFRFVHVVLLGVQVISSVVGLTRLKLVEPPKISLRDSGFAVSPVSTPPQRHASPDPTFTANPDNDWSSFHSALPQVSPTRRRETTPTPSSPFGPRQPSQLRPSQPQLHPDNDPDEMDWKPTISTPLRKNAWQPSKTPKTPQQQSLFGGRPIPNLQPRTPFSARNLSNNPFDSPATNMDSPATRYTGSPFSTVSSFGDGSPQRRTPRQGNNGSTMLAPPRFFPQEEPTGLESLFESNVKIVDDAAPESARLLQPVERKSSFGRDEFDAKTVAIRAMLTLGCNVSFAVSANSITAMGAPDFGGRLWALGAAGALAGYKLRFKWGSRKVWDVETVLLLVEVLVPCVLSLLLMLPDARTATNYAGRLYLLWMTGRELFDGLGVLQTANTTIKTQGANGRLEKAKEAAARPMSAGRPISFGGRPRSAGLGGPALPPATRTQPKRNALRVKPGTFVF